MNDKKNCIIVGAGDFFGFVAPVNKEQDLVIAADGGYNYLKAQNIEPDLWIGDSDSLNSKDEIPSEDICERIILPKEKDDTDTLAAVKYAIEQGCKAFHIYGGTGGRMDHTIANIKVLSFLAESKLDCYLYGKDTMTTVIQNRGMAFPREASGMISVFSMSDESRGVTIRGLKYEMVDGVMKGSDSIGVSNEFIGEDSFVAVRDGKLLIVVS